MDKKQEIQNFTSYITNKARPLFESLIKETTRENYFPGITDIYDSPFRELFESSIDSLGTIIYSLTDKHYPFKELYSVCHSLLCKDDMLSRVTAICAEFLRKKFPSISVKGRVSDFASEIRNYSRYLLSVICLSSLGLSRWPFNEAETANIMVATAISRDVNSELEKYLKLFRMYENAGVDLSHLDYDKIIEGLHKTYLLYLCDKVTIAFFFYKNEDLRNAFINTLKLKALVNSNSTGKIMENIKRMDDFVKILEIIAPSESENLINEKKKIIEERVKAEIKSLLSECLVEDEFPFIKSWKSDVNYGFQKVINQLEAEIKDSDVRFNFDFLRACYERSIEKSYREIIELMTEETFETTLINEITDLAAYITAWRIIHYTEEIYHKRSIMEFLYSFADKVIPYEIISHVCPESADKITEKLKKVKNTIREKLEEIKKLKNVSLREITLYIREKFANYSLYREVEYLVNRVDVSDCETFKNELNYSLSRLFRYYSENRISFHSLIAALAKISQTARAKDERYQEWFAKRIERRSLNNIYKAVITGRIANEKTLKDLKGLYVLFNIIDILKQEFEYKPYFELSENSIFITRSPDIAEVLILALIVAELLKFHRKKGKESRIINELLEITLDSGGMPVPVNITVLRLENAGDYFSGLINTQHDKTETETKTTDTWLNKEKTEAQKTEKKKVEKYSTYSHRQKIVQLELPF